MGIRLVSHENRFDSTYLNDHFLNFSLVLFQRTSFCMSHKPDVTPFDLKTGHP